VITLLVNVYADPDPHRDAELRQALDLNRRWIEQVGGAVRTFDGRPTVGQMLAEAGDGVNVLANSDILVASMMLGSVPEGEAWALTRWDCTEGQWDIFRHNGEPRCDSQDVWAWRGKLPQKMIGACNFTLGVRGCDNRLTAEFSFARFTISNPSLSVKCIHLHASDVRRYGHAPGDAIDKPYLLVSPHKLGEIPKYRWIMN
jgi:hypothetical protein